MIVQVLFELLSSGISSATILPLTYERGLCMRKALQNDVKVKYSIRHLPSLRPTHAIVHVYQVAQWIQARHHNHANDMAIHANDEKTVVRHFALPRLHARKISDIYRITTFIATYIAWTVPHSSVLNLLLA